MRLNFEGWGRLRAIVDRDIIKVWLGRVAEESENVFRAGMLGGHSGRIYNRRRGLHQASAPGEYPANDSGALLESLRTRTTSTEATIGTNMRYSRWLRGGSRRMARRKMSDNALIEGAERASPSSRGIVHWKM